MMVEAITDLAMQRLAALGIGLPKAPQPLGAYLAVVEAGTTLHVSMQGPVIDGRAMLTGLLGQELSIEEGRMAARLSVLNALAQVHQYLGGFERIRQVVRLEGYVACDEGFMGHPQVLDGASELLASVFESRAGHVRSVCGVRNLPGNLPVAVALTFELDPGMAC
ncbi:RidA family protein [Pseudomonas sp. BN411]|nr:RidA family protein [Pseudomonas sp. BN411]